MKKKVMYLVLLTVLFFSSMNGVMAEEKVGGCAVLGGQNSDTVKLLSWAVRLIRFGIPIIVIILGITDFLKILFSGEDKIFKDAFSKFVKRITIGVVTIFVPYILYFIVSLSGVDKQYGIDNFFCGIIDATSGVKLETESFRDARSCRKAGYYWISSSSRCEKTLKSINSKNLCNSNWYEWEEYTYSNGNAYGGKCFLPTASSIHGMSKCNALGYEWDASPSSTYGGTCRD